MDIHVITINIHEYPCDIIMNIHVMITLRYALNKKTCDMKALDDELRHSSELQMTRLPSLYLSIAVSVK